MTKKTTWKQTISQKSHQWYKYLGCPPPNLLGIVLEVDEGRTSTNGPENKRNHDDV